MSSGLPNETTMYLVAHNKLVSFFWKKGRNKSANLKYLIVTRIKTSRSVGTWSSNSYIIENSFISWLILANRFIVRGQFSELSFDCQASKFCLSYLSGPGPLLSSWIKRDSCSGAN